MLIKFYSILVASIDVVGWTVGGQDQPIEAYAAPMTHVTAAGILLGLAGLAYNLKHNQTGQIIAWLVWLAICVVDLVLLNAPLGEKATLQGEYAIAAFMRLVWFWLLFNWTFSRKGTSWSIYPATPDESTSKR